MSKRSRDVHETSAWSTGGSVCLECRTVVDDGAVCPGGERHRVRSLAARDGREDLLTEVWGPPSVRRRLKTAARAGATGGASGGLLDACSFADCGGGSSSLGEAIGAIVLFALLFIVVYVVISAVAGVIRRRSRTPRPRGASSPAPAPGRSTGAVGTVLPVGSAQPSPMDGRPCLAFGVELSQRTGWWRRAVTLRKAATLGFDVRLDSGETLRIPPGRCVLDLGAAERVYPDQDAHERFRQGIDPRRRRANDLDPFPADRVDALVITAGDRVEVLGALIAVPDPRGPEVGYREAASSVLAPRDLPRLRLRSRDGRQRPV